MNSERSSPGIGVGKNHDVASCTQIEKYHQVMGMSQTLG